MPTDAPPASSTWTRSLAAVVALLVVATAASPPFGVGAVQADEDGDDVEPCQTEVAHDAFLTDEATIEAFNETGSASDVTHNTKVTVEESSAFYRVKAVNPNSYCVHTTVSVSSEILPPTTLGNVSSTNEVTTATWTDVLDFERQEAHTEIAFVMPPNSTVLFAPSKPTVLIPAWRDERKHQAQTIIDTVLSYVSDEGDLEKRTYTFEADGSPSVTIPLSNTSGETNRSIDEWRAVYRTSESEPWAPVGQESDEPVFYQTVGDGDDEKVRFYFNDRDATVQFTANPDFSDRARWQVRSFYRSLTDLGDLLPFAATPTATPTAVPTAILQGGIAR